MYQSRRNKCIGTEFKSKRGIVTTNYLFLHLQSIQGQAHGSLSPFSNKWPHQINMMVFSNVNINNYRLFLRKPNLTKLQLAGKKIMYTQKSKTQQLAA